MDVDMSQYGEEEASMLMDLWKGKLEKDKKTATEFPMSSFLKSSSKISSNSSSSSSSSLKYNVNDFTGFATSASAIVREKLDAQSFVMMKNSMIPSGKENNSVTSTPEVWKIKAFSKDNNNTTQKSIVGCENPLGCESLKTPIKWSLLGNNAMEEWIPNKMSTLSVEEWTPNGNNNNEVPDLMALSSKKSVSFLNNKNTSFSSSSPMDQIKSLYTHMCKTLPKSKLADYHQSPQKLICDVSKFWSHYFRNKNDAKKLFEEFYSNDVHLHEDEAKTFLTNLNIPILSQEQISNMSKEERALLPLKIDISQDLLSLTETIATQL